MKCLSQPIASIVAAARRCRRIGDTQSSSRTRPRIGSVGVWSLAMCLSASDLAEQVPYEVVANLGSVGGAFSLPVGGVIRGADGALYGTTSSEGGSDNCGTVYRFDAGELTLVHRFDWPDGCWPVGELALAADGSLVGATGAGGNADPAQSGGTIYKIAPDGTFTVLYRFPAPPSENDPEPWLVAYGPDAGLVLAADGWFYGTTFTSDVFRISTEGVFELVHQYSAELDPQNFHAALVAAPDGRLYTTAPTTLTLNPSNTGGAVFSVGLDGTTRVAHRFLAYRPPPGIASHPEGAYPFGEVAVAADGVIYGATTNYGPNSADTDRGTIFKLASDSALTVLHGFSQDGDRGYSGGSSPYGGVILGSDGHVYGQTFEGGTHGKGVIYRVSPDGRFTALRSFDDEGSPGPGRLYEAAPGVFYGAVPSATGGVLYRLDVSTALLAENLSATTDAEHQVIGMLGVTGTGGASVTFSLVTTGQLGVAAITDPATGAFTYTPNPGAVGTDSFTFQVGDGTRVSNRATVIVTIVADLNFPPAASDLAVTTTVNTPVSGTLVGSDPDGTPVTFVLVTLPSHGSVALTEALTGQFVYTPNAGTAGSDSFTFYVTDGMLNSNVATVRITIEPPSLSRVRGDFDGGGDADLATFDPTNGLWTILGVGTVQWGRAGDIAVPADYDGDGRMDVAVWRPSTGTWLVKDILTERWGGRGDVPVPGDYDGDGDDDLAVYHRRTGTWSIPGVGSSTWGHPGDVPVPADYDGDRTTDIAVRRPSSGAWHVKGQFTVRWGRAGDLPVPADYDADGAADLATFRFTPQCAKWSVRHVGAFAVARDVLPVAQDVDGDGRLDLTVYAPASGLWRAYRLPDQQLLLEVEGPTGALPALLPLPLLKRVPGKVDHHLAPAGGRGARGHEGACAPSAFIR